MTCAAPWRLALPEYLRGSSLERARRAYMQRHDALLRAFQNVAALLSSLLQQHSILQLAIRDGPARIALRLEHAIHPIRNARIV